jgi:hypothetical protein
MDLAVAKRKHDWIGNSPKATLLAQAREAAGLDMFCAAIVVPREAEQWAAWEAGAAPMEPAIWELWTIKVSRWCAPVAALTSASKHQGHFLPKS